jgi:molybdopterin adenylyltransferase
MSTAAVVTVSDGVHAGTREDISGETLVGILTEAGFEVTRRMVIPDDAGLISRSIRGLIDHVDLVVTTGGTGFGPRDVTPEATRQVIDREAPGMMTLMISRGSRRLRWPHSRGGSSALRGAPWW